MSLQLTLNGTAADFSLQHVSPKQNLAWATKPKLLIPNFQTLRLRFMLRDGMVAMLPHLRIRIMWTKVKSI